MDKYNLKVSVSESSDDEDARDVPADGSPKQLDASTDEVDINARWNQIASETDTSVQKNEGRTMTSLAIEEFDMSTDHRTAAILRDVNPEEVDNNRRPNNLQHVGKLVSTRSVGEMDLTHRRESVGTNLEDIDEFDASMKLKSENFIRASPVKRTPAPTKTRPNVPVKTNDRGQISDWGRKGLKDRLTPNDNASALKLSGLDLDVADEIGVSRNQEMMSPHPSNIQKIGHNRFARSSGLSKQTPRRRFSESNSIGRKHNFLKMAKPKRKKQTYQRRIKRLESDFSVLPPCGGGGSFFHASRSMGGAELEVIVNKGVMSKDDPPIFNPLVDDVDSLLGSSFESLEFPEFAETPRVLKTDCIRIQPNILSEQSSDNQSLNLSNVTKATTSSEVAQELISNDDSIESEKSILSQATKDFQRTIRNLTDVKPQQYPSTDTELDVVPTLPQDEDESCNIKSTLEFSELSHILRCSSMKTQNGPILLARRARR
eukprot:CAMPEP_0114986636 /NCGR_PEP_ID=MMETSP0216-20121206/8537_1 /TAXON_ID=223996 /ORGANISM="Protocruzia adherens, Strain Boccale" /LENGTH=486 /DNA_ID=CAMNT_0002349095 /DNA_START=589 /DNA_END=2049 /DNA_ORIENTATION=+